MRKAIAVMVGIFTAFLIVPLCDVLAASLFTMPDIETADRATLPAAIAGTPLSVKSIIACSWLLAPFGGAWLALRFASWTGGGWIIVTAVFLFANIYIRPCCPILPGCRRPPSSCRCLVDGWGSACIAKPIRANRYWGEAVSRGEKELRVAVPARRPSQDDKTHHRREH